MNVKEYISSGIVELYAMNALSPEDKNDFEKMGLLYPEIGEELRKVEKNLENYASSHSLNPRPQLREDYENTFSKNEEAPAASIVNKKPEQTDHSLTYKYLIAASLAALVISTFASWFFYSRWNDAEERYTALLKEKNELSVNFNVVKTAYDETLANLLIIRDELSVVVTLHPIDTSHSYQARIYWNKYNRHTYLDVLSLPDPANDKQYQLWSYADGKTIDAGAFQNNFHGIQRVKDVIKAESWIVTLEPKGGSVIPSMDYLFLVSLKD